MTKTGSSKERINNDTKRKEARGASRREKNRSKTSIAKNTYDNRRQKDEGR